jgi:transcriptional regulator with XRE-family HTH domain
MLITGNQLKAARALADTDQKTLALEAGVNVTTISAMEAKRGDTLTSGVDTVEKVRKALEAHGIEFLNGDAPGVRLRKR